MFTYSFSAILHCFFVFIKCIIINSNRAGWY